MYGCEDRGALEKIGKVFVPSIHCAAEYGNLPAVRAHLESGEDVNKREPRLGQTALHLRLTLTDR